MIATVGLILARRWRRAALVGVFVVAVVAGVCYWRWPGLRAQAQTPHGPQIQTPTQAHVLPSDYANRVVAYIHQNQAITRQELGEYLVARFGPEKIQLLVNKRLLDSACRAKQITVTAAEVDAELAHEFRTLNIDQNTFVKNVLPRYKKNLYEFKEDILRPRLQLTRLCQPNIVVTDDDLRKAFDSVYGEKVECRLIMWPADKKGEAEKAYGSLRDSEDNFVKAAKHQNDSALASSGGRIHPISRNAMDPAIEKAAFELQPGQVSTLIDTRIGNGTPVVVLLKCDRRVPADTTVNFGAVKSKLDGQIREAKLQIAMGGYLNELRKAAAPVTMMTNANRAPIPTPTPATPVATIEGQPVTREELGEFLIARYGGEKLGYLVNRCILQLACQAKNINISEQEIDESLKDDLKLCGAVDAKYFEEKVLPAWEKSMYEWREDVVRTRLMLSRLAAERVQVTDEDLRKCFEAHHGEKRECRMIMWPPTQARTPLVEYARLRDSEEEFCRAAKMQPSAKLAAKEGKIPPFGRFSLDDEQVEREAFRLKPGEISALIETPHGQVILKCDRHIPPDTTKKFEEERHKLMAEVHKKKTQFESNILFKELHTKATPQLLLQGTGQPEDLAAIQKQILSDMPQMRR